MLLIVYAYSKWIDVYPVSNPMVETIIPNIRSSFEVSGISETVCTDNGHCFTSKMVESFMQGDGIQHMRTTPYDPASNG